MGETAPSQRSTLGLIGIGRMGRLIKTLWQREGYGPIHCVHSQSSQDQWNALKRAGVLIDVSHADATQRVCDFACRFKIPLVLGTTGWDDQLPLLQKAVLRAQIPCLCAPNFSLGLQLLRRALRDIAPLLGHLDAPKVSICEIHHKDKRDRPSGTAKALQADLAKLSPLPAPQISSLRRGKIAGKHEVLFETRHESLLLRHVALNRFGLARGAIHAAHWLIDQPGGWYAIDDWMHQRLAAADFASSGQRS